MTDERHEEISVLERFNDSSMPEFAESESAREWVAGLAGDILLLAEEKGEEGLTITEGVINDNHFYIEYRFRHGDLRCELSYSRLGTKGDSSGEIVPDAEGVNDRLLLAVYDKDGVPVEDLMSSSSIGIGGIVLAHGENARPKVGMVGISEPDFYTITNILLNEVGRLKVQEQFEAEPVVFVD